MPVHRKAAGAKAEKQAEKVEKQSRSRPRILGKRQRDRGDIDADDPPTRGTQDGVKAHAAGSPRILGPEWDGKTVFTIEEAGCKILRLSRVSAYSAAASGELPTVRFGRRMFVPRHALEKLLTGNAA